MTSAAEGLDQIRDYLARFVAFPTDEALNATTLWVAHTHIVEAFDTSPRIAFLSPEPGSGKTRALEILENLVKDPLLTVNMSPAYLFRKVGDPAGPPTLLFDEIDTVFGPRAKDAEDIRGMLNAGYRRGATAGRCVVKGKSVETEDFPAFSAVALAGLDDLPDTIMTRSVIIRMRRRAPDEHVSPYRRRIHAEEGHQLRDQLAKWAQNANIGQTYPELPDGIEDRNADVWEPLIAIADAAGGHWPDTARVSAVSLVSLSAQREGSLGIRLLADIRDIYNQRNVDKITTHDLIDALTSLDESPWADLRGKPLDPRGLSYRLGKYGISPRQIRIGDHTGKGYHRTDLHDTWQRYLPAATQPSPQIE